MASDNWISIRLGDVCSKIGSGATPRGGASVYLETGEIALIRSQNIYNEGFRHEGLVYISEEHAEQLSNVEVESGDVLLNITGASVARCCQVDTEALPARVNQHVSIIRPDPRHLDARFLRYSMISPQMQAKMLSWAGIGGTREALTKGMIESFQVFAPKDVAVQQAIARILGALDDKIELNRRENQTLEATARAIFKSWFVDFDPVRAKAAGEQPPGLAPHVADLFPDAFEESELDEIPKRWRVKPLDRIANYQNGLALQRYPPEGDEFLPVIKIRELRQGSSDEKSGRASPDIREDCIIEDGDVIFSWSGSLLVDIWCGGRGALNQHLFKVTSASFPKWFYYHWTKHHLSEFQRIAAGKATTMGHIKRNHLSEALVAVPPDEILEACTEIIDPLIASIVNNNLQARTLAELRDTLLPKLISGELRVEDAERIVGRFS